MFKRLIKSLRSYLLRQCKKFILSQQEIVLSEVLFGSAKQYRSIKQEDEELILLQPLTGKSFVLEFKKKEKVHG